MKKRRHDSRKQEGRALIAAKTLSRVEVDPASSNQHEFHAGRLRKLLGFGDELVHGRLVVLVYTDDGSEPMLDEGNFTLYDAREQIPGRREWHLYYRTPMIQRYAREGDLLLLYRPEEQGSDLHAIVARVGTTYELELRRALTLKDHGTIARFVRVSDDTDESRTVAIGRRTLSWTWGLSVDVTTHSLYIQSSGLSKLPSGKAMASAAAEIAIGAFGGSLDADSYLLACLDAESQLFYKLEESVSESAINALLNGAQPSLSAILNFAMVRLQARKSRRGRSLEYHMQGLFDRCGIPYTAQCETEPGARSDFVIPGCKEYHRQDFASKQLRMVGCKSRVRERWPQYLKEAARIDVKYHVSIDEDLTEPALRDMHARGLRLYMPKPLIDRHYAASPASELIGTLEELVSDLRAVVAGIGV